MWFGCESGFAGSPMTSKYNRKSLWRAAIFVRIASTAERNKKSANEGRPIQVDQARTQVGLVLRDGRIRAHSLILPIHEHPQSDLVLIVLEKLGYPSFKRGVGLRLENTERMEL